MVITSLNIFCIYVDKYYENHLVLFSRDVEGTLILIGGILNENL